MINEANEPSSACRLWRIFQVETSTPPTKRNNQNMSENGPSVKERGGKLLRKPSSLSAFTPGSAGNAKEFESNERSAGRAGFRYSDAMKRHLHSSKAVLNSLEDSKAYRTEQSRWKALERRDPASEDHFVYAVATTGIFCRPTCPARLALRENILFFDRAALAVNAGFRACRRCQPMGISQRERDMTLAAQACRLIEAEGVVTNWKALTQTLGLSRFHFHRVFKRLMGITPREYAVSYRNRQVQLELRKPGSVTEAIYKVGFNSSSRFYEPSAERLGMTPSQFRGGGQGIVIQYAVVRSPLGWALIAGTSRGICAIHLGNERAVLEQELRRTFGAATIQKGNSAFNGWVRAVVKHLGHSNDNTKMPLDIRGTAFQLRVWQALREIPPGQTATYSEIAARIGQPTAARAVARACAANRIAVVVPCHRVVRTDGSLSGYRWGVERKRELLKREQEPARTSEQSKRRKKQSGA
jgi:AraC family transcriptional regulator of adaptative response/methylated-DNA-[protein]-cysteine methyltransferase